MDVVLDQAPEAQAPIAGRFFFKDSASLAQK